MSESFPTAGLGELVNLQTAKVFSEKDPQLPYIGLEHMAQGAPRLLATAESRDSVSVNSLFKKDDILFGKLRPNLKKSLRAPFDGYCSTDILVLRCRERVNPAFAAHVFQWDRVFAAAAAAAAGTKMPRTSWDELRRVRVFAPESEHEQFCIATVLDLIDEAIAKTEAVIAKLKQVRVGLLHDLLTCGIDENKQLRDPVAHPEHFKDSPVGLIPKEWTVRWLEEGAFKITDGAHTSVAPAESGSGVIPFLYVSCVRDGRILWDQASLISEDTYRQISRGREPLKGMVLYTVVGSYGHAAVLTDERRFSFQRHIACIYPKQDELSSSFLAVWMNSPGCRSIADRLALGNAQRTITLGELKRMPYPQMQMEEQTAICERLNYIESDLKSEEAVLSKLNYVKSGLVSDLLSGRVHVPESIFAAEARA